MASHVGEVPLITTSSVALIANPRKYYRAERFKNKFPFGRAIRMRCKCTISREVPLDSPILPPKEFIDGTHPAFKPCGKDYLSNLPGEIRNMIYREVLDSYTCAGVRCRKCRFSIASKPVVKRCTSWFMINRVTYAETTSLFFTAYLPNMAVVLNSIQELSDCISVFADRCPGLVVSLIQFHSSMGNPYSYDKNIQPFVYAFLERMSSNGLEFGEALKLLSGERGTRWVDKVRGRQGIVHTLFTTSQKPAPTLFRYYPRLFIRGNVGRAPWLREILNNPITRELLSLKGPPYRAPSVI